MSSRLTNHNSISLIDLFELMCTRGFDEKEMTGELLSDIERRPRDYFNLACINGSEEMAIYVWNHDRFRQIDLRHALRIAYTVRLNTLVGFLTDEAVQANQNTMIRSTLRTMRESRSKMK